MPKPSPMSDDDLKNRFGYHAGNPHTIPKHEQIRELTFELAKKIRDICPPGRNLSLAITHLEDVRMRANAAIACDSDLADPAEIGAS